jgi:hypothetical protein
MFPSSLIQVALSYSDLQYVSIFVNYFGEIFPDIFPSDEMGISKLIQYLNQQFRERGMSRSSHDDWVLDWGEVRSTREDQEFIHQCLISILHGCEGQWQLKRGRLAFKICDPIFLYSILYYQHHQEFIYRQITSHSPLCSDINGLIISYLVPSSSPSSPSLRM